MTGGFASVHERAEGMGGPLGAAVALDDRHVLTCAHVLPAFSAGAWLRRPDGAARHARVLARSPGLDLMVLVVTPGFLRPAAFADQPPVAGQAVWALGAPGIGPTLAAGQVDHVEALLQGTGPGFTARMPALMGYSGGPIIDVRGRVIGLTAAMLRPTSGGGAMLLARLSGMDLAGLTRGQERRVFALSVAAVREEAARLLA